jgi:hypothetical protein
MINMMILIHFLNVYAFTKRTNDVDQMIYYLPPITDTDDATEGLKTKQVICDPGFWVHELHLKFALL